MRTYQYRCIDHSLLTPWFKKYFVYPLINFTPWGLPANIITIISNAFFYVALYFSIQTHHLGDYNFIVIPALLLLYLIGDHLDGAQAKRTQTGSALGEFCDHYLDAFNNGILIAILINLYQVSNPWVAIFVLVSSYLAHVIVFYEQYKTGCIIFEKLGSLEGVLLAIVVIFFSYFDSVYALYTQVTIGGFSVFEILLLLMGIGGIITFIKTIRRVPDITYSIWMFAGILVLVSIFSSLLFTMAGTIAIVSLYASLHVGKLMKGHLLDGMERSPGLFLVVFLTLEYFTAYFLTVNTLLISILYLSANILWVVIRTASALKQYWLWVNPSKNEKSE